MTKKPIVYHIPVCPFSQRLEILLALRGTPEAVEFRVVDITRPRDPELLRKTRGTTALPVLVIATSARPPSTMRSGFTAIAKRACASRYLHRVTA